MLPTVIHETPDQVASANGDPPWLANAAYSVTRPRQRPRKAIALSVAPKGRPEIPSTSRSGHVLICVQRSSVLRRIGTARYKPTVL